MLIGYSELCVFGDNGSKEDKMTTLPSEADQVCLSCVLVLGGNRSFQYGMSAIAMLSVIYNS